MRVLEYTTMHYESPVRGSIVFIASTLLVIAPCSCSQRHSHIPPPQFLSTQETIEIVRSLLAAKELAESQACDPNVSELTAEDSAIQAAKAERAIKELSHGYEVPQTELADALEVPPRHLSPQGKADLIRQLRDAKALDDRNEQELLGDYFSGRSVNTDKFDAQKELVDQVIKDLQIGEDVHWSTIQAALKVPASAN